MLITERLNKFPKSNILVISPTKPLSSQIAKEVEESTNIPSNKIALLTGAIKPEERTKIFNNSKVIVATPQTIQFDVEKKRINLEKTSLLVVDECHRSKERFAFRASTTQSRQDHMVRSGSPWYPLLSA